MSNYAFSFRCAVHNLRFAFDRPEKVDAALLRCPMCAHERELKREAIVQELKNHRDLLLQAIELKRLVQPD